MQIDLTPPIIFLFCFLAATVIYTLPMALSLVDSWQARRDRRLKEMPLPVDECPSCKASFIGGEIPEQSQEFYGSHTHFRLERQHHNKERQPTGYYECHSCQCLLNADGTIVENPPENL
jgi:hypothetical protein